MPCLYQIKRIKRLSAWEDEGQKILEHGRLRSTAPEAWNGTERAGMVAAFCHTEIRCVWGSQPVSLDLRPEGDSCLSNLHMRARPFLSSQQLRCFSNPSNSVLCAAALVLQASAGL